MTEHTNDCTTELAAWLAGHHDPNDPDTNWLTDCLSCDDRIHLLQVDIVAGNFIVTEPATTDH